MALSSLRNLPEIEVASEDEDFASGKFGNVKIDVLLTRNKLFDNVHRQHATTLQFGEPKIPCANPYGDGYASERIRDVLLGMVA